MDANYLKTKEIDVQIRGWIPVDTIRQLCQPGRSKRVKLTGRPPQEPVRGMSMQRRQS
ncbi:30106_t:CDS:1, partial [Gigaspora margarita]